MITFGLNKILSLSALWSAPAAAEVALPRSGWCTWAVSSTQRDKKCRDYRDLSDWAFFASHGAVNVSKRPRYFNGRKSLLNSVAIRIGTTPSAPLTVPTVRQAMASVKKRIRMFRCIWRNGARICALYWRV